MDGMLRCKIGRLPGMGVLTFVFGMGVPHKIFKWDPWLTNYPYTKMQKIRENATHWYIKIKKYGVIYIQMTEFVAHVFGKSPYLHLFRIPPPSPRGAGFIHKTQTYMYACYWQKSRQNTTQHTHGTHTELQYNPLAAVAVAMHAWPQPQCPVHVPSMGTIVHVGNNDTNC